jgi:hypothetical protein
MSVKLLQMYTTNKESANMLTDEPTDLVSLDYMSYVLWHHACYSAPNYPCRYGHHFTRLLGSFTLGPNGPPLQMQVESVRDGLFLGLQCIQPSRRRH